MKDVYDRETYLESVEKLEAISKTARRKAHRMRRNQPFWKWYARFFCAWNVVTMIAGAVKHDWWWFTLSALGAAYFAWMIQADPRLTEKAIGQWEELADRAEQEARYHHILADMVGLDRVSPDVH